MAGHLVYHSQNTMYISNCIVQNLRLFYVFPFKLDNPYCHNAPKSIKYLLGVRHRIPADV